jgi:hypothetical protein
MRQFEKALLRLLATCDICRVCERAFEENLVEEAGADD